MRRVGSAVGRSIAERGRAGRRGVSGPRGRRRRRGTPALRARTRSSRQTRPAASTATAIGSCERDERHHVERAEPRVDAGVGAQVDRARCDRARSSCAAVNGVSRTGPGQGEHRPVVIGVGVQSSSAGPHAALSSSSTRASRPSDTFGTHSSTASLWARWMRTGPDACPSRLAPCASAWLCLSTTTRSRESLRCGTRPSSTTREQAEQWGYDSLWLSDHLFLDLAKYGGPATRFGAFEPIATLAALGRAVPRVRLGTLVLCEALRPAAVLAKSLATLDRVIDGRLDIGLGAGWYEPDYEAIGMTLPSPGERIDRLREALARGGRPARWRSRSRSTGSTTGRTTRSSTRLRCRPRARRCSSAARATACCARSPSMADGWNTCWAWTPDQYRERLAVLEAACDAVGRDPATVWRSLGLYALAGENEADLQRRFERLAELSPPGILDGRHARRVAGRVASWGPPSRSRPRSRTGTTWASRPSSSALGCVPFHVGVARRCGAAGRGRGAGAESSASNSGADPVLASSRRRGGKTSAPLG